MKSIQLSTFCLFVSGLLAAQTPNVLMGHLNNPNEVTISMDTKEPRHLLAAANKDNIYTSRDGGLSWTYRVQESTYGVAGDPITLIDRDGKYYHIHLSNPKDGHWLDRIVIQRSDDRGKTWNNGSFVGLNGEKQQDKPAVGYDSDQDIIYLAWTQFDKYGSHWTKDSTHIHFSSSADKGATWSEPQRISITPGNCMDDSGTVMGTSVAVGPKGEVYVVWAGPAGMVVRRSFDQGKTWDNKEHYVYRHIPGWKYEVPGIGRANGLPAMAIDLSKGVNRGRIYVTWTDANRKGGSDVWLAYSSDSAKTWTKPIKVNPDAPGKYQFFSTLSVDQKTGVVWVAYYDRRMYTDNRTDVATAFSADGGNKWIPFRVSESPFTPDTSAFFGDYMGIVAHDNNVRPVWTRLENGYLSVWTAIVDRGLIEEFTGTWVDEFELDDFPPVLKKQGQITISTNQPRKIDVRLLDEDNKVLEVLFKKEKTDLGETVVNFTLENDYEPGYYFFELCSGKACRKRQTIVLPSSNL